MRPDATREQLIEALRVSGISLSLAAALQSKALALALRNTAIALEKQRKKSPPIDHKRLAAGDID